MFSKNGGNLGENGCVAYMFDRKSLITVPKSAIGEDALMEAALGAGADDMQDEDENWVVVSTYTAHDQVLTALQGLGIEPESAELGRVPQVTVKLEGKQAASVLRMIEAIEEQDDVQNVFANFEIDDEELEKLSA